MGNYKRRFVNKQMLAYYHNKVKALLDLKSDKTHTHKYAGSDTVGGVANSAYKLQTGRKIAISDDLMGEVVFDGTKDVVINVTNYRVDCSSENTANYPWHRIASVGKVTASWKDKDCVLSIRQTYNGGCYGILKISLRTNNVSSGDAPSCSARWLLRSNDFAADTVKIGYRAENGSCYLDVFAKCGQYARMIISQIEGDRLITLVESSEASNTTASSKGNSVEVYKSVEEAGPAIHNKLSYTTISNAVDDTLVDRGNVAARLARNADFTNPMTFNWTPKDGQPTHLWGGENGADMYVYNPSKFRVAHADSAARLDIEGTIGSANKPVYFKNGNPVESNFTVDKSVPADAKFTDTVYTHPTSSGNKHIPAGGNSGQILRWASDGTAKWGADQDTTYSTGKNLTSSGTTFRLADVCDTVTDWNAATTMGFFMAYDASNAPVGSTWFYGQVIAHTTNYVRQILYRFAVDNSVNGGNCDRYERVRQNGSWGDWTNTSVRQYVPLSGGTMTGDITFDAIGDTATSKGLHWSGSTDGADIFYRTDSKDHGRLVLNITDDADARIDFALNKVTKSYIDADGNFSGKASTAGTADVANKVAWGNVSGKPSSYTPSSHTHTKSQITDFPTSLPASDVYPWAKASTKPSYSASEVGAVSTSSNSTVNAAITFGEDDKFGIRASSDNYGKIGESGKAFYEAYINNIYRSETGTGYIGNSTKPFKHGYIDSFRGNMIRPITQEGSSVGTLALPYEKMCTQTLKIAEYTDSDGFYYDGDITTGGLNLYKYIPASKAGSLVQCKLAASYDGIEASSIYGYNGSNPQQSSNWKITSKGLKCGNVMAAMIYLKEITGTPDSGGNIWPTDIIFKDSMIFLLAAFCNSPWSNTPMMCFPTYKYDSTAKTWRWGIHLAGAYETYTIYDSSKITNLTVHCVICKRSY